MTTTRPLRIVFGLLLTLSITIAGFKFIDFNEPKISLEGYQIEDGFELSVIASEKLFKAPVSMDFDNKGRITKIQNL